jgi:hypothetical protein
MFYSILQAYSEIRIYNTYYGYGSGNGHGNGYGYGDGDGYGDGYGYGYGNRDVSLYKILI